MRNRTPPRSLFAIVAASLFTLMATSAAAQSFPVSDEDGLADYGSWQTAEWGLGGSVRTDTEGGWSQITVTRQSSNGIAMDFFDMTLSYGIYDDFLGNYSRLIDQSVENRVQISIDGEVFKAANASYSIGEDGGLVIGMSFTPMSEDDGHLDLSEPNCRVVTALRNSHEIVVSFPSNTAEITDSFVMSGRGSSAALRDVCGPFD